MRKIDHQTSEQIHHKKRKEKKKKKKKKRKKKEIQKAPVAGAFSQGQPHVTMGLANLWTLVQGEELSPKFTAKWASRSATFDTLTDFGPIYTSDAILPFFRSGVQISEQVQKDDD